MNNKTQKRFVVIFGKESDFIKHLVECLEHAKHKIHVFHCIKKCVDFLNEKNIDVVIYDLLEDRSSVSDELKKIIECDPEKIILMENAKRIYENSKNVAPYTAYKKLIPKNIFCIANREIEKIVEAHHNHIIFRVAEVYGPSIHHGFVNDILHKSEMVLNDGKIDILYEGDLVHSLEIGIETDAIGIFDIASGKPIGIKKLVEYASKQRKTKGKIRWNRKKIKLTYNCENFKYYKWHPLVSPEVGIKVTKKLEEVNYEHGRQKNPTSLYK